MNLWWLHLSADQCSFTEITKRRCIAIGWPEIGPVDKHIKSSLNWERRFKTYIQVKGDVVYAKNAHWREKDRELDQVPDVFLQLLQIKRGDLVVAIESGSELTFGRPVIRGVCRANEDAFSTYRFEGRHHNAHAVSPNTQWIAWDRFKMGELKMPNISFRGLCAENSQLTAALAGWTEGVEAKKAELNTNI